MVSVRHLGDGAVATTTPYSAAFVEGAKRLSGSYMGDKQWRFPTRLERQVRDLLIQCYGTDGMLEPTVDIEIDVDASPLFSRNAEQATLFGRLLVFMRFGPAQLGSGVHVSAGTFQTASNERGGLSWEPGTLIEVHDVPMRLLSMMEDRTGITRVGETLRLQEMREERELLLERIARLEENIKAAEQADTEREPLPEQKGSFGVRAHRASGERTVHYDGCPYLKARRRITATQAAKLLERPGVKGCKRCKSLGAVKNLLASQTNEEI